MKKILIILLTAILIACVPEEQTPVDPPPADDVEHPDRDDQEIDEIIDALEIDPYWNEQLHNDSEATVELVYTTCDDIDDGTGIEEKVDELESSSAPQLSAEHMVEVAVFIVCPEFESDYESYTEAR